MPGPLDGIRLLDLTSVLLGPYATMMLGDMGADVIKVEGPEGDSTRATGPSRNPGMASFYLAANRSKRSVVLDLKKGEAREILMRLVEDADVFVHSIRPRAMERLGFGPDAVLARNPRIVYAGIHGFGDRGPYANRPAYDDIIQGGSGLADLMQRTTGEPRYTPMVAADKTCGLMTLNAILAALLHRERTGEGQAVEIPMFETMVHFNLMEHSFGHIFDPPLAGMGYSRMLAEWRRPYPTADGWICLLAYNDRQWQRLVTEAGRPQLAEDPRCADLGARSANIADVYALVGEILRERTTAAWLEALVRLEIPHMPVHRLEDLENDPHLRAVGFFRKVDHPTEGPLTFTDVPVRFAASPAEFGHPPPRLGQDTISVMAEAGYEPAEIDRLLTSGAAVAAAATGPKPHRNE